MKIRSLLGHFLIAALALVVSGQYLAAATQLTPVNIGYYPGQIYTTIIWVSQVKGFYKEAGLDPTLISTANGPLMNSELASGAIDLGINAPSQLGIAREQGLDVVFAAGNARIPWVLVARSDVKLPHKGKYPEVIGDLKGLSWGVYGRGSDGEIFMRMMASDAKLDPDKDIAWIGVGGPATGLPALQTNRIGAYLTLEPAPIVAKSDGYGQIVIDLRKGEGPGDLAGIVYQGIEARRKTIAERPEIFRRTIRAHEQAYCWIKNPANFDELILILKSKVPVGNLNDEQFRAMVKQNLSEFTLTFPRAQIETWSRLLVDQKVLKSPINPDEILWAEMPQQDPKC